MTEKLFQTYKKYMKKAIILAKKGAGNVSPNPLVGAILLDKDLNFVSSGYHKKFGEAHAEVNAIAAAKEKGLDFNDGTIIITLEPCSHYGKTPPCADLIINSGIKTIVAGCFDPNEKVAGNGIKKCKEAGLTVVTGILEKECKKLNEIFFKNQTKKSTFVAIKSAITLDGKIATENGSSKWITGKNARSDVQKLRNHYDAILTSSKTVIADNPSLTCRCAGGRNPVRIIVDSHQKTSADSRVYQNDGTRVILATILNNSGSYPKNVEVWKISSKNNHVDLKALCKKLYDENIFSVLVEAGGELNGSFFKERLADKLYLYTAPKILGDNRGRSFASGFEIENINSALQLNLSAVKKLGDDILMEFDV